MRIGNPCVSNVKKAMLHEDDRYHFREIRQIEPHHGQHIVIPSFDLILDLELLINKTIILDDLFDRLVVFWMVIQIHG